MSVDLTIAIIKLEAEINKERHERNSVVAEMQAEVTKVLDAFLFPDWSKYDELNTKFKVLTGQLEGKHIALEILQNLVAGKKGKKGKGGKRKKK